MEKTYIRQVRRLALVLSIFLISHGLYAQNTVSIGTTDLKSDAVLWLNGTGSQGLLLPVADKDNFTPSDEGMMIYDAADNMVYFWTGATWQAVAGGSGGGADNWGTQVANTDAPLTGDGTSASPITLVDGNSADQILVWDGSAWGLEPLPSGGGGNAAADITYTDTNGLGETNVQGAIDALVAQTDSDNQQLQLSGTDLAITGGNSVDLSAIAGGGGSDDQDLQFNAGVITLENDPTPTSIDLSNYDSNVADDVTALNQLTDVNTSGATNGQVLKFQSGIWVPENDNSGGAPAVDGITITLNGSSELQVADGGIDDAKISDVEWSKIQSVPAGLDDGDDVGLTTVAVTGPITGDGTGGSPITVPNFTSSSAGLVPNPGGASGRVLDDSGNWITLSGGGNMNTTTYDTGSDGVVDDAENLDGQAPSFYLDNTDAQNLSATDGGSSATVDISGGAGITLTEGSNVTLDVTGGNNITINSTGVASLPVIPNEQILISNGTSLEGQAVSGDINITNTGLTTITNNAITGPELAAGAISGGLGGVISDGTITNADINNGAAINPEKLDFSGTADGDILQIAGGVPVWSAAGGGNDAQSLQGTAIDPAISGATDGQVLKWSNTNSRWELGSDDVGAGGAPTLADGQIITGDGSNNTASGVTGDLTMSGAGDFQIVADAVTTNEIGTAGLADADKVLTTDLNGDPQWETKASLLSFTDTDDQQIDQLTLNGTDLEISLTDDGVAPVTVDLSSLDTDDQDATEVPYDGSSSGLVGGTIGTTQAAIDEVQTNISSIPALPATTDAQIIVSNGANPEARSMSGDVVINNTGLTSIQDDAVQLDDIQDNGTTRAILANGTTGNVQWVSPTGDNQVLGSDGTGDLTFRNVIDAGTGIASPGSDANLVTEAAVRAAIDAAGGFNTANEVPRGDGSGLVSSNIFSDGTNVGIGVPTPTLPLELLGTARFDGLLVTGNNITLGSGFNVGTGASGGANAAVGFGVLGSNSGSGNAGFGSGALFNNDGGNLNTGIGNDALINNISGSDNTAMGGNSLQGNILGSGNTTLGARADVAVDNLNNSTAIGLEAIVDASNTVRLGRDNTAVEFNGELRPGGAGTSGAAGQFLQSNGTGVAPTWVAAPGGGSLQSAYDGGQSLNLGSGDIFINGSGNTDRLLLNNGVLYINNDAEIGPRLTFGAEFNATEWTLGAADQPGAAPFVISNSNDFSDPLFVILGDGSGGGLDGNVGIGTLAPQVKLDISGTDAIRIPVGTTVEQPGTPAAGMLRFNSTTTSYEGHDGSTWNTLGGAGASSLQNAYDGGSIINLTDGTSPISISATSGFSDFEEFISFDVSDASGGLLIGNSNINDGTFSPSFQATTTGTRPWLFSRNALDAPSFYFELSGSDNGGTVPNFATLLHITNNGGTRFSFTGGGQFVVRPTSSAAIALFPYGTGIGQTSELGFAELAANGNNRVNLKAPDALDNDIFFTLPTTEGSPSQVLTTDGSGNLSWSSAGAAPTLQNAYVGGSGISLTSGIGINVETSTSLPIFSIDETNERIGFGTGTPSHFTDIITPDNATPYEVLRLSTLATNSNVDLTGVATGSGAFRIRADGGGNEIRFQTNGLNDRMVINSSGDVGIGTTTPQNVLDVEGGVAIGTSYSGTETAPSNGLIVQGATAIGTPSALNTLTVGGTNDVLVDVSSTDDAIDTEAGVRFAMFDGLISDVYKIVARKNNATANSGSSDFIFKKEFSTAGGELVFMKYDDSSNDIIFNDSKTTAGNYGDVIFSNGDVGVGATSPAAKLDIIGDIKITDGTEAAGRVLTSDANGLASWQAAASSPWTGSPNISYSAGNVGINSINPGNLFEIRDAPGGDAVVEVNGRNVRLGDIDGGGTGANLFIDGDGAGEFNFVNGNVGMGTSADNFRRLYVLGGSTEQYAMTARTNYSGANEMQGVNIIVSNSGTGTKFGARANVQGGSTSANIHGYYAEMVAGTGAAYGFYSTGEDFNYFSGNVGIGTTLPSRLLQVNSNTVSSTSPQVVISDQTGTGDASMSFVSQGGNTFTMGVDASDGDRFKISDGTSLGSGDRFTLDAAGNIGIGTTTQIGSASLTLSSTSTNFDGIYVNTGASGEPFYGYALNGTATAYSYLDGDDGSRWKLFNGGSDRIVVESTGDVGFGINNPLSKIHAVSATSSTGYAGRFVSGTASGADGLVISAGPATPTTGTIFALFTDAVNNFSDGSIRATGAGGVQYNTTSDRRLKQNITDLSNALASVMKMRPRDYEFKVNPDNREVGFIAQELVEVFPQAVSGDPNGDVQLEPMMVDYSKLTPILTGAIQEQQEIIDAQKVEIEALKAELSKVQTTTMDTDAKLSLMQSQIDKLTAILTAEASKGKNE